MQRILSILLAMTVVLAGCADNAPDDDEQESVDPVDNDTTDDGTDVMEEAPIATGGDPEDDTSHSDTVEIPGGAEWKHKDHRFRIFLKMYQTVEVGEPVRITVDVGSALVDAGLEWIHPGVAITAFEADPRSVIMHQVTSAGRVQNVVPLEARQAELHSLEIAFEHIGGNYILYFGEVQDGSPGGETAEYPDAVDGQAHRSDPQWQGNNFWGVTAQSGIIKHWPGDEIISYATIHTQGREAQHGAIPLPFHLTARTPPDWEDVEVDPDEESTASTQKRVSVKGTSPDDASGSDTLYLDVHSGNDTVSVSILIKYHET